MTDRKSAGESSRSRRKPATTPEGREAQLVSLAIDLAEKQLIEGTASAQVISHYLKLGSSREKLEQQKLARENSFLEAKTEALASNERIEELYGNAIRAMHSYSGRPMPEDEDAID